MLLKSFVYTDVEGERKYHEESDEEDKETKGRRWKMEKKKRVLRSCRGQLQGSSSPLSPSLAPARSLRGSRVPEEKHLGPHHPWTQSWAVYLGLAAWQLYWCYIQAHRDPESEREQEHREEEEVEEEDAWGMEEWGGWRTSDEDRGWRGGKMAQVEAKRREDRGVEREVWGSESVRLLWS